MSRRIFRGDARFFMSLGLLATTVLVTSVLATDRDAEKRQPVPGARVVDTALSKSAAKPAPIPKFAQNGIDWLIEAQHPNGGWGAGSHAHQQNRDPHTVKVDPATTAFVCTTLLRAGSSPTDGQHKKAVRRGTEYLCQVIERYDKPGPKITDMTGTQIQAKLGSLVDTVMTSQYLARVLNRISDTDPLRKRVDKCLDECVAKLEAAQGQDGSWNVGGGWAPVLQSSIATSALEFADAAGKQIDADKLARARDYQKGNYDRSSGRIRATAGAGVALYALSSSQRANAAEARAAEDLIQEAKDKGRLDKKAQVSAENLSRIGVAAPKAERLAEANASIVAQNRQIGDENILRGFGNNGGEEFLSYLQASESFVIMGGDEWQDWNAKMHKRLSKIQNQDGSWSGHHCITSPTFCTAAVVQCITTDRDAKMLIQIAKKTAKVGKGEAVKTARKGA